jgi:hypothetical protein
MRKSPSAARSKESFMRSIPDFFGISALATVSVWFA